MKKSNQRSSNQDKIKNECSEEINITIILSEYKSFDMNVPSQASIEAVKSLMCEKIKEFDTREVVGFESDPCDYLFDYRFSKNVGVLNVQENRNVTLQCLFKNSSNGMDSYEKPTKSNKVESLATSMQKICKYKICKPLSSGGFSRVYLVRNLQNGQFYAAKFMDKRAQANADRQEAILNQFCIHKSLNHPYIVKMEEYIETEQFYVLILEYCPGGELFTLLKNNRYMGEGKAKTLFIQVLLAIKYLHERNIVFRDIKPENILIDAKGNAKLTDFGLAKEIRGKTNSYCGSVEYMAPQIVSKQTYSFDVDLYCMGALLYEILIGCPPFYNPKFSNSETKYHICNSEVSFPSKVPLSKQVKDLIAQLLVKNPNQRLGHIEGVDEIFQHQWIGQLQVQHYLKGRVKNPFVPRLDVENFDRQQDQYELNFRKKILQDIKNCKEKISQSNLNRKQRQNSHLKSKSQSLGILGQQHNKSKSQQDLIFTLSGKGNSDAIKVKPYSKKLFGNKQNPYDYELKNKSVSQINLGPKEIKQQGFRQTNGFKKKKQQKVLSKSFNKTSYNFVKSQTDPENEAKIYKKKQFFINSKSCGNSRKSSLYKVTSHGNFNKYASLTGFNYKSNSHQQSCFSKKSFIESQEKPTKIYERQKSRQKSSFKNHPSFIVKSNIYQIKQTKEKENVESKGLKKNMIKKKFMFSSSVKQSPLIKTDHLRHELKAPYEKLSNFNRQTLV